MEAAPIRKYTYEEYLEIEQQSNLKHEFYQGEVFAMTGGTLEHSDIGGNVYSLLRQYAKQNKCKAYYETKLQVKTDSTYTYPDVMLTCDTRDTEKKRSLMIEYPSLLVEVLSNSTKNLDKNEKLAIYRKIPSLLYYLTIDQYKIEVEVHSKATDIWRKDVFTKQKDVIELTQLELPVSLEDIYEGIVF